MALVFVLLLCAASGVRLFVFHPPMLWIRDIAGSISLVCTFFALVRLPAGDVLALTNIFPLWIALLSWPVLGVRPTLGARQAGLLAGAFLR